MDWFLYDNALRHERVNSNPVHATDLFLYPLKRSESQKFFDVFRGLA